MKVVAKVEYQTLRQIGAGEGMNSKVFLAKDPQLAGTIAVKEVPKKEFGNKVDLYFAEAQAMYKAKHDNIVPVHYACETDTHVCIAMPFFKKGSFAQLIEEGPAPASLVLSIGQAVLTALAQIHLRQLLHLDVKPSNVLLSDRGIPMLADFGQAREMSATGVATLPRLYYLAVPPEAYSGVVAVPSDVYQAGLLLYRAANGDPHFRQQWTYDRQKLKEDILEGRFPHRKRFLPHVPKRLRTAIRKALRVKPEDRYQSATEFADALGKVPCELDWTTTITPSGDYSWRTSRHGQPDLLVTARASGPEWSVEVFTVSAGGKQRAKSRALFWRKGMPWKDADRHLNEVFLHLR